MCHAERCEGFHTLWVAELIETLYFATRSGAATKSNVSRFSVVKSVKSHENNVFQR